MKVEDLGFELVDGCNLYLAFEIEKSAVYLERCRTRSSAIFAVDDESVVGVLCFTVDRHRSLQALGTWVRQDRRREGLAELLWSLVLTEYDVRSVVVEAISDRGFTLIERLRLKYPAIDWQVSHYGGRALRVLAA